MQFRYILCITTALLVLIGCDGKNLSQSRQDVQLAHSPDPVATPVDIDITTPDRAIKSYWKVQDQIRTEHLSHYKAQLPTLHRSQASAERVMTGTAFTDIKIKSGTLEIFTRDIVDVKVESESRAVIIASIKNSTLIPAGAEVSKFQEQSRNEGDKYKYVLEKSPLGWQIAEIWEFSKYTSPPGWSKIIPGDGKPYVSSLTYDGR